MFGIQEERAQSRELKRASRKAKTLDEPSTIEELRMEMENEAESKVMSDRRAAR